MTVATKSTLGMNECESDGDRTKKTKSEVDCGHQEEADRHLGQRFRRTRQEHDYTEE